jgi:ATP-dependent RNA helicase DeaD
MPFPAVNPALERALVARAYAEPTPVQLAVLAPETDGRDMLVSAQTGSGKTVAFGLALSGTLLGGAERFERAAEPLALIIAPTRELAIQVQRELAWLYAETGARIASCVGGMDPRAERDALGVGAHIVVGTPGRLRDHLERGRLVLSKLRAVVLDEADEMLDLGFREDLQFILDATPAERQTLMFSATVRREIEHLARTYQRDAVRIATTIRNEQHGDIEYRAVRTVPNALEATVVNLLRFYDAPAALVFCGTREGVRRMQSGLMKRGFLAVALSGELSQAERTEALEQLRQGRAKVLVATDVAARGLDLAELTLVIHADLPNDKETLLHRSGRTGRAGRKGISALIVPPNRRRRAEELLGRSRITAVWENAPGPKEIAAKDHERLNALTILDEPPTADDLAWGRELLEGRTPELLAAALVRMYRAGLPVAEGLRDLGRPPLADRARPSHSERRSERAGPQSSDARASRERTPRQDRDHRPRRDEDDRRPARSDDRDAPARDETVWFGLNIGREKNADVRWLLPLICRVGDVTKREIGAIKVGDSETRFEILAEHADNFANAVKTSKHKEGRIWRIEDGEDAPHAPAARTKAERPRQEGYRKPKPHARASRDEREKPAGKYRRDRGNDASSGNAPLKRLWKEKRQS